MITQDNTQGVIHLAKFRDKFHKMLSSVTLPADDTR